MKIINKTRFDTAILRRLLVQLFRWNVKAGNPRVSRPRVTIKYLRGRRHANSIGGYAWLDSNMMTMRMPRSPIANVRRFCMVAFHEMGHLNGHNHREGMCDALYYQMADEFLAASDWNDLIVEKVETPKVVPNKFMLKFERAAEMVLKKQRDFNRAKNALKKWMNKQKYYQNRLAVAAKQVDK